jgi:hypothetical protein
MNLPIGPIIQFDEASITNPGTAISHGCVVGGWTTCDDTVAVARDADAATAVRPAGGRYLSTPRLVNKLQSTPSSPSEIVKVCLNNVLIVVGANVVVIGIRLG